MSNCSAPKCPALKLLGGIVWPMPFIGVAPAMTGPPGELPVKAPSMSGASLRRRWGSSGRVMVKGFGAGVLAVDIGETARGEDQLRALRLFPFVCPGVKVCFLGEMKVANVGKKPLTLPDIML